MADIEKTISNLQILRTWCDVDSQYGRGLYAGECEKAVGWLDDALALLKALQPRVLTLEEYQKLAQRTANPELITMGKLQNGVMGLCGESGECVDLVKKVLFQGHNFETVHGKLVEELGDVCWYVAETASALGVGLEEVMQRNIDKLKARYPDGFSAERSINRGGENDNG